MFLWCLVTGRFLAELTQQVFSDLKASKYQVCEEVVSVSYIYVCFVVMNTLWT